MNAANPARWLTAHLKTAGTLAAATAVLLLGASLARSAAPAGKYTIATGTVTDVETGLMWQRVAETAGFPVPDDAQAYCQTLALDGFTGWRLPTVLELLSLVDQSVNAGAKIDATAFPGEPADTFWTSTVCNNCSAQSFVVDFTDGLVLASDNTGGTSLKARCVRDATP